MSDMNIISKDNESKDISLIAFKYGESTAQSKHLFYKDTLNTELCFSWLFYLIRYKNHNILVDTGVSDLNELKQYHFSLYKFTEPVKLLERYGLKSEEITDVIITHSDFDHIGDINYYKNASIYIQEDELQDCRSKIENLDKVTAFADSMKLYDKLVIKCIGAHKKGSSIVMFDYGSKSYILAGDECYLNANIEKHIPPGRYYDISKSIEFIENYNKPNNIILLCHEPSVIAGEVGHKVIIP